MRVYQETFRMKVACWVEESVTVTVPGALVLVQYAEELTAPLEVSVEYDTKVHAVR
jgi:hypothetical protein